MRHNNWISENQPMYGIDRGLGKWVRLKHGVGKIITSGLISLYPFVM